MPALPQRAFCEWLGTAFLLAAVVGSGIMAQGLAGDAALALLCNTLATGAILAVLILVFGPLSGAHFNPAVSIGFALRSKLPWPEGDLHRGATGRRPRRRMGGAPDVRTAGVAVLDHGAHRRGAMARGSGRDLRPGVDDLRLRLAAAGVCSLRRRPLYHGSLLVHG